MSAIPFPALERYTSISVSYVAFKNILKLKLSSKYESKKKKIFYTKIMFILRNKLEKQFAKINSWAVLLGSPNFAVRPGTSQNSPFHRGPVQSKK